MEWPEPEPLTEPLDAQPFPDQVLPRILRDAVRQAQAFVQAPMALVACSALSGLSLAAQGLANVRRDHQLVGPRSLYLLAVADSGERKITCDAIFCPALRDWETGRRQEMSPEIAKLEAATAVFEAKKAGILEAIKHKRRRAQDTAGEERECEALVGHAPVPPLIPRLLYGDATPEALAHALATGWPSGGVLSAEAGAVFGAHGMGQDTILRNLALLNVLWDGGEMAIDRRSKPSFVLRGRRLTFGLRGAGGGAVQNSATVVSNDPECLLRHLNAVLENHSHHRPVVSVAPGHRSRWYRQKRYLTFIVLTDIFHLSLMPISVQA